MKNTKTFTTLSLLAIFVLCGSLLLACSGGGSPPSIPTPTAVQPNIPPTAVSPATTAPTATKAATASAPDADKAVIEAFAKYQAAKSFRLDAQAELSSVFFQGQYTPGPGADPNKVTLFAIKGEQNGADSDYAINGFMASFIGLLSGFDPNSQAMEVAQVDGTLYMHGKLQDGTREGWYSVPAGQAASTRFAPQDIIAPMAKTTYPAGAFSKTGSENIGSQTCGVFTGSRAAFDAVFPQIGQVALLSTETLDLSTIDRAEYKVWVCADGNVYRIQYNFDAHSKTQADKKGSFALTVDVSDYGTGISIQAPTGALPLPVNSSNVGPTAEPTESYSASGTTMFTSPEGEWEGKSDTGSTISFTVTNNAITFANLNYSINTGSCSLGGAYSHSVTEGAIQNQSFSFVLTDSDGVEYTFTGTLSSNNDASGTVQIKGKTFCGDTDNQVKWTAKHISSPDNQAQAGAPTDEPTAVPTEQATVEPTPGDSANSGAAAQVVTTAFHSLANKDVDGALRYFDENVVYTIPAASGIGATSLKSYMQFAIGAGSTFELGNLRDLGGAVTFTVKVTGLGAGTYSNSSAVVQDGKIAVLTIQ